MDKQIEQICLWSKGSKWLLHQEWSKESAYPTESSGSESNLTTGPGYKKMCDSSIRLNTQLRYHRVLEYCQLYYRATWVCARKLTL